MFSVNNLSVHFGGRTLFDGISFQVNDSDRIGLAGKNGAGKSTLLKIIAGLQKPDEGNINIPGDYIIGYLPQEIKISGSGTVFEEAEKAFERLQKLEQQLNKIQDKMHDITDFQSDEYAKLVEDLTHVSHQHELLGGNQKEKEIELVLSGLGFKKEELHRPLSTFSGGWQMRVELAKILLAKPDLLLLDEPTNHLDIESILWLEQFMLNYPGSIILVSHDKALLNNMTNRTIELEAGRLYDYKANYDKYIELRKLRRERAEQEKKQQDKYIEHTEQLINKFRAKKNKAAFAQSLIKKLDKLERVELDEEDVSVINIRFPEPPRSGKVVVDINNLKKSYGEKEVLKGVDLTIERGEKIAFVGKNGEGKTTLSKIIAGREPYDGHLDLGYNVELGYFEQHQAELMETDKTVFDTIDQVATGEMRTRVRGLLGAFLFSGDDVDKKVKVLSGGEKGRLALAKLLLQPSNLLIMDEPTNHLDMRSKDVLKHALKNYSGTMIIVSHDRDFLQGLTEKVYEFKGGFIKEYLGDINYFLEKREIDNMRQLEMKEKAEKKEIKNDTSNKELYELKKQYDRDERKISNNISRLEKSIEAKEAEVAVIEKKINDPSFYEEHPDPDAIFKKLGEIKAALSKEMEEWEQQLVAMEELKEQRKAIL